MLWLHTHETYEAQQDDATPADQAARVPAAARAEEQHPQEALAIRKAGPPTGELCVVYPAQTRVEPLVLEQLVPFLKLLDQRVVVLADVANALQAVREQATEDEYGATVLLTLADDADLPVAAHLMDQLEHSPHISRWALMHQTTCRVATEPYQAAIMPFEGKHIGDVFLPLLRWLKSGAVS